MESQITIKNIQDLLIKGVQKIYVDDDTSRTMWWASLEVIQKEVKGSLWYIDYKLENEDKDIDENNVNISSEIIRLNKLKNEGLLTEKEYEQAKRKLLD